MKRIRTKYLGVYRRKSSARKFNGKPDECFDITYKLDGKKIWEKVGWASEGYSATLATQIRGDRMRSIRHGEELPRQRKEVPYFKDVAAKYLEWARENKARAGIDDISRYKNHIAARFDETRLNEISALQLEKFKSSLLKKGLAPATVKHCLVLIRQMFNKADLWGMYHGTNPIKGVKLPKLQNERKRFLSHDEARRLLERLKESSEQLHDMAVLCLHCGLRNSEIFNLKMQDLDFENDLINISDPKNKESRKAFMTETVKKILRKYDLKAPGEYVFKNRKTGGKITVISNTFSRVVDDLGFNKGVEDPRQMVTFYTLRRTFASWLLLQGEPLLMIKELLGQKTLAMAMRYAHLKQGQKKQATLNLEKAFNEEITSASEADN